MKNNVIFINSELNNLKIIKRKTREVIAEITSEKIICSEEYEVKLDFKEIKNLKKSN